MTLIKTALHKFVEMTGGEEPRFSGHPHYVIDQSLIDMMTRADVQSSISAMVEAEIARLPYPKMVVEFELTNDARRFVVLEEQGGSLAACVATLYRNRMVTVSDSPIAVHVTASQIAVASGAGEDARAVGLATAMALLLLNTKGVSKDVIDPERLNRARIAKGIPPVPKHTVLRIGTVYSRDGAEHTVGGGGTRTMAIHMRAGHTRSQPCGPGNLDRKIIYLPPVIVNYRPGDDVKIPTRVIRR